MSHPALPELSALERIIDDGAQHLEARIMRTVVLRSGQPLPIYAITLGNPAPELPAIGIFGGIHGLERIGANVAIAYLHYLAMRLQWDATLHRQLDTLRLVFMPLVNPGGMLLGTRANPNGVDLMRNAPLESSERVPLMIGGQRISPRLPWYRGSQGDAMEIENQAVSEAVADELLGRQFSLAVDCHSGFGLSDRIWFPYAHTRTPFCHLAEIHALKEVFFRTHLHHPYIFEPQSRQYLAHGDLWDYLHQRACGTPGRIFLPLTLEMGSWQWIKKNPRQLLSRNGMFNPLIAHRQQRVLRRHVSLLDFLSRATCSAHKWLPQGAARAEHHAQAVAHWYA
ncbi:zinc carboxypeptidase [Azoarcus sp. L1K30]|uniref:M14 family zinc carboxypeptidase n=1 Tax=Azoarcus sp. L1K30 TaxID=2820277 RepID=UPI001B8201FB|nr:zinc carboxypeptidase [Azoarcus sp. L1K30]